jgi:hypothetical protein
LGLTDTSVETDRFEVVAEKPVFAGSADIVTVRAVRTDDELFGSAARLLKNDGKLLMFRPSHSVSSDPVGFKLISTVPMIEVPKSFLSVYRRVFHVEQ